MEFSNKDQWEKNKPQVKTFPVPFALGEMKENISISTNNPSKPSKEEIINQAIEYHLQGNIQKASKYYKYCLSQGYQEPTVFSNYGLILKDLGKLQEAEIYYRKAIEIKPDFVDSHLNLAGILKNLGKLKEAEISLHKAIKIKPDLASAHYNLGNIFGETGNLQEAESSTRKAIELNPNYAKAYSQLGQILLKKGKHIEGIKMLKEGTGFISFCLTNGLSIN